MTEHIFYNCPPECDKPHCNFCEGGLAFCTVCKGAEGDLPTECPGRPFNEEDSIQIYNGALDYLGGEWVRK